MARIRDSRIASAAVARIIARMSRQLGTLLVVSGPSGSGKTTLCRKLAELGEAHYSISCTTRAPREGEQDGRDYHFLTWETFTAKLAADEFLEHAEVHGNHYGSLKAEVLAYLEAGTDVVMDIDVQGAAQVRQCGDPLIRRAFADVFVMPHDEAELRARLSGRGTDSEETIALRMANALEEIQQSPLYQYRLLSTTRDEDFRRFLSILTAERMKTIRSATA
jgi:guanylate kinase